jgi:predicted hotdog family 3-hydroxylacyl-ACP dehydratase
MLHDAICARLPHAGRMCLLERLESWDEDSVTCIATSHRDADNPLRRGGHLPAVAGVEYAAQAMALHGNLLSTTDTPTAMDGGSAGNAGAVFRPPAIGYLASVRDLKLDLEDLGTVAEDLRVTARRLSGDTSGFIYEFEIRAGTRALLSGRLTVKLLAAGDGT